MIGIPTFLSQFTENEIVIVLLVLCYFLVAYSLKYN